MLLHHGMERQMEENRIDSSMFSLLSHPYDYDRYEDTSSQRSLSRSRRSSLLSNKLDEVLPDPNDNNSVIRSSENDICHTRQSDYDGNHSPKNPFSHIRTNKMMVCQPTKNNDHVRFLCQWRKRMEYRK
jgi:hypothetical protein